MKTLCTLQCVRDFECKTKITTQPQAKGFSTIPTGCVAANSNKSADIYQHVLDTVATQIWRRTDMHRINTRWILPHYVSFLNIVCGWIHGDTLIWTHECIHVSCSAHRLIKTPDSQSSFSLSVSPSNMLYVQTFFSVIYPQVCVKFGNILCLCKQDLCLIWFNTKSIWISKLSKPANNVVF